MAKTNPPPLQMPTSFTQDKEIAGFFDQLLRAVYQMWVELFNIRSREKTTTTNATPKTLQIVNVPLNRSSYIEARVAARRTGGSAGTAGDTAFYVLQGCFKNIAGTVSLVASSILNGGEDQAAWDLTFSISGSNVYIYGTGAANNNITWESSVSYIEVGV